MIVSFANPEPSTGSRFGTLSVQSETSGGTGYVLTLNTPAYVLGNAALDPLGPDIPAQVNGAGELIVSGSIGFGSGSSNIAPAAVRVGGALNLIPAVTYGAALTEFFGSGAQVIPYSNEYFTVLITGDSVHFDFGGSATIGGDLYITGNGLLDIDSATVSVLGNVVTQDQGRLMMDGSGSSVTVANAVSFGGGSTSGIMSDGTLRVAGDFTQSTGFSAQSFAPSMNHITVLDGTGTQQVSIESPTLSESRFHNLQIENTSAGGIVLNTALLVRNNFLTPLAPANTATVFGNGNTLTTYSIDIENMVFSNAQLDVLYEFGYAALTDIDDVTFQNMDQTVTQFGIVREDQFGTFTNITFSTVPTTGLYAHFDDPVDSGNNAVFTMQNPSPAYHSGFALVTGFAFLSGWLPSPP
jgi:hypothetical protein